MSAENSARSVYDQMWEQFDRDCEHSWSQACRNLRRAMCVNAGELVPTYTNMKDHMDMVFKIKEQMKSAERPEDKGGNPVQMMASWISGESDLSRVPMIKEKAN